MQPIQRRQAESVLHFPPAGILYDTPEKQLPRLRGQTFAGQRTATRNKKLRSDTGNPATLGAHKEERR